MEPPRSRSTRWTDDELRAAVASERSWRGTARALGLKGTSGGGLRALKRRATELGIDSSHFTQQRRWSDRELRDAVANASSWSDVLRSLGLTDCAEVRVRLKGHAVRLGVDVTHLARTPRAVPDVDGTDLVPEQRRLPEVAEQIAAAWFGARGAPVATPNHPCAYDLLVMFSGRHQRVQVKTTTWRQKHGSWVVNIGQRPYVLDKSASRQPYDPDDLDYFLIIDGDLAIYLIPSTVVAGRTAINVGAYAQYRIGDASSLFDDRQRPSTASAELF